MGPLDHQCPFKFQEELFCLDAARVPDERAVRTDDAVAWDDDRDRVGRIRASDGLEALACTDALCKLLVTDRGAVRNLRELFPHADLERRANGVDGTSKLRKLSVEVTVQLVDDFFVARFIVAHIVVVEMIVQPLQKIFLRLPRYTDLAHPFFSRSDVNQTDLGIE